MIYIAHRGNINGPNPQEENNPLYIENTILNGYDVEIDLWYINNEYFLGHDRPDYKISYKWICKNKKNIWCHCKNIWALHKILKNKEINAFFHNEDDCTLTSFGYIWTYPRNILLTNKSIAVMPERVNDWNLTNVYGICTDFPSKYKSIL
jgi:hypothetical protein